jgi:bifunctional ADP-heptose synthase (sugar kinase/adenylyltransferase)
MFLCKKIVGLFLVCFLFNVTHAFSKSSDKLRILSRRFLSINVDSNIKQTDKIRKLLSLVTKIEKVLLSLNGKIIATSDPNLGLFKKVTKQLGIFLKKHKKVLIDSNDFDTFERVHKLLRKSV